MPKLDDNYFEMWNSDQELRQEDFAELMYAEMIKWDAPGANSKIINT